MTQENRELQHTESQLPTERGRPEREAVFIPRADIIEKVDSILVVADMPGVDEKSLDIQVERNLLTLVGRVEPELFAGYELGYQEYESGRYERQFTLSDEVNVNGIEASVKNGVLRIELPKAESAKPRKIEVKVG